MTIAIRRPALGSAATAFLAKKHQAADRRQMGGCPQSGKTFAVEDPATEEIIAHVPAGDKADIDLAVPPRAAPSRPARGRAFRRPHASVSSGSWATCWNSMPTNSPSSKRSTTASR